MGSGVQSSANDSDSEDERAMTPEEFLRYNTAELNSDGFDVPYFPDNVDSGRIMPILSSYFIEHARGYARIAIDHYNKTKGESYEMVKLKKANYQQSCGIIYYLTFYVKPIDAASDAPTMTFQARVLHAFPSGGLPNRIIVELCRPEPEEHKNLCSVEAALTEGLY